MKSLMMCVCVHKWVEYILFASLLVVVCIIFAIMGYFYTYIDPVKIEAQFAYSEPEEDKNRRSLEMVGRGNGYRKRSDSSSSDEMTTRESRM